MPRRELIQNRSPALDVIRCVACFCVISVHFFNRIDFFAEPVNNRRMVVMLMMRSTYMICVPLFMLLSGYLLCRKKPERAYYGKLWRVVIIYLLSALACQIYRAVSMGAWHPFPTLLRQFLGFEAAPYGWYVEMYIGLFLIIPFLNILYRNIPSRGWKLGLIGILLGLTALPGLLNSFCVGVPGWWSAPASSKDYVPLLPDWWVGIYPITYYLIGCYLREYGCRLRARTCALLALAAFLLGGLFNLWRSWGVPMQDGGWNAYSSILVLIPAVLVFVFFLKLNYDRMPMLLRRIFFLGSELSLGAYLVSWIFDVMFSKILKQQVPVMNKRLEYFFVVVPLSFLCSMLLSYGIQKLYRLLSLCGGLLRKRWEHSEA